MKNRLLSAVLCIVVLCGVFTLTACDKKSAALELVGTWRTDNIGYYTITTFTADGKLQSDYSVSDTEICDALGLTQEVLDSMDHENFYKAVSEEELGEEEKKAAQGKNAIKIYMTAEDMEADKDGVMSYYSIEDNKLTIDGCVYVKEK